MNRKIKTSSSRRPFLHQKQPTFSQFQQSSIIRPTTSHPYSTLNHYRSSTKISNQYESNYFSPKLFNNNKQNQSKQRDKCLQRSKHSGIMQQQIPKGFKLLLTQVRVLLKGGGVQQEKVGELMKGFIKKIREIVKQNEQLKMRVESSVKQLMQQKQAMSKLRQKIKQQSQVKGQSVIQKQNVLYGLGVKRQPSQFQLMLQNLHLTQINTSYLNTIKQLKQSTGEQKVQIKKQVRQSDSGNDMLRYHNRINYLQMKITNSQTINKQLSQKNDSSLQKIEELTIELARINSKLLQSHEERNQWRQRALMQREDNQTKLVRQNFLLFSVKKLREANKSLADKFMNITEEDNGRRLKQLQPNPYFHYQVDFFKSLKIVYFQNRLKEYKLTLQGTKDSYTLQPLGLQHQYLQYRRHQQTNLSQFSYLKPTFFSFIQQCVTNDITTCRVKGSTSLSRIFIQLVRAIMNSKTNQFFLSHNQHNFIRFPQFVYSWFEKFYFNSEKYQVSALEPFMQKPITQDIFYRDLMNVKLDQSWEIITFREFLLEELNLQELYFYLMCQNLLYKRAAVTEETLYQGEFTILVDLTAAKSVLDLVLSDFESWNVTFLTSKLREKVILKKNVEFIQSGFFLRCLIQYYKIERINRYKYLNKLCDQFKSCQQNGLRFSSFISVINRFTEISPEEKVRIYRDCYSVSRGKITADVVFTVCTEQLVFLRYLKLKCFYKLPTIITHKQLRRNNKKRSQEEQNQPNQKLLCLKPSDPYIYEIFTRLNRLLNTDHSFTKQIQKLGVSQITSHFQAIKRFFTQKSTSNDSSILKCKHFIHFISYTMQRIRELSFQNFYLLLQENSKKRGDGGFWIQMNEAQLCDIFVEQFKVTFNVYEKINKYKMWKQEVYAFRVKNAARKIQKQVRKKFIEPFMKLYKIIYSDAKKDDQTNRKIPN